MKTGLVSAIFVCMLVGCSQETERSETNQDVHIVDQLTANLDGRRSWPVGCVKIHLTAPPVITTYRPTTGQIKTIHAWPENSNDYSVPMMRINSGDTLYQISEDELSKLKELNEKVYVLE